MSVYPCGSHHAIYEGEIRSCAFVRHRIKTVSSAGAAG